MFVCLLCFCRLTYGVCRIAFLSKETQVSIGADHCVLELSWLNQFNRCGGGDNLSVRSSANKFYCSNLNGTRFYAQLPEGVEPPVLPVRYRNFRKNVLALTRLFTDQQRAIQQEFQPQPLNSPKQDKPKRDKPKRDSDTEQDEDANSQ